MKPSVLIQKAVKLLRAGKLIVIPTETVYGLAADANNLEAIKKIFAIKKRSTKKAIPIFIPDDSHIKNWAIDVPEYTYKLTKNFWPGPLTIVLKKAPHISDALTCKQNTIALRCPDHPIAQQILKEFNGALAVTSANISGEESLTSADEVRKILGDKVDLIVDGGKCKIGVASTIVDLTKDKLKILREGTISEKKIISELQR